MKRCAVFFLISLLLCITASAGALVERCLELNVSFSMLEEGNPFLERYNEITGAEIEAEYELGVPYMFGGKDEDKILSLWYVQETTRNFTAGELYLYGFDCSGFASWINFQCGKPELDSLEQMITNRDLYGDNQLDLDDVPFDELQYYLEVGDFLVANHDGRHIMMYIGTLADYGYTAEDAPELADYLDYPLVIHCGLCPPYGERYAEYIEENGLNCNTTDGGVAIAIVGMPVTDAPHYVYQYNYDHYYFDLDGYFLRVYDIEGTSSYVWFRS